MSEVRRMGFDNLRDAWRITDLNSNFEYVPLHYNCVTIFVMKARLIYCDIKRLSIRLCCTYPKLHIVPAKITDKEMEAVGKFRTSGRFPSVVWR